MNTISPKTLHEKMESLENLSPTIISILVLSIILFSFEIIQIAVFCIFSGGGRGEKCFKKNRATFYIFIQAFFVINIYIINIALYSLLILDYNNLGIQDLNYFVDNNCSERTLISSISSFIKESS